jgi:hypothetical protein
MLWAATKTPSRIIQAGLFGLGIATIGYNAKNFLEVRAREAYPLAAQAPLLLSF